MTHRTTLHLEPVAFVLLKRKSGGNATRFIENTMKSAFLAELLKLDVPSEIPLRKGRPKGARRVTGHHVANMNSDTLKMIRMIAVVTGETEYNVFYRVLQKL